MIGVGGEVEPDVARPEDAPANARERQEVALVYHQLQRQTAVTMGDIARAVQHDAAHAHVRRALRDLQTPRPMPPDCLDCAFFERKSR